MVKKCDPAIFLNQIKNLFASSIFVNLLILTLILFAAQKVCAQTNYYSPFASYNSSPYGINSGATYSNDYFSSSSYGLPSLNSYYSYPGASGYSTYPGASSYSAQNSLYYPNAFGSTTQNLFYPSASTGSYYNTQNAYTPAQNSYYSPGAASPYTTQNAYSAQGSYYNPSSGFAQTNSYYNGANTYNAANSYYPTANTNTYNPYGNGYYSTAATYYQTNGGYVINSTSTITGTWVGTWVRNFSSTGAPTSQSGSSNSNSHSMNNSSSTTNSSHSGSSGSSSTRFSAEDIKIELAQNTNSVNGTVTFFENTVINAIPVSGTLINGVLDLYGTTGTAANPYALQVTANIDLTVEDANIQGAYTLTNTVTNTNIELGTFNVER